VVNCLLTEGNLFLLRKLSVCDFTLKLYWHKNYPIYAAWLGLLTANLEDIESDFKKPRKRIQIFWDLNVMCVVSQGDGGLGT